MAGITWWTGPRKAALKKLIEVDGLTYAQAAAALQKRFRREPPLSESGCRQVGQGLHLAAKSGRRKK